MREYLPRELEELDGLVSGARRALDEGKRIRDGGGGGRVMFT